MHFSKHENASRHFSPQMLLVGGELPIEKMHPDISHPNASCRVGSAQYIFPGSKNASGHFSPQMLLVGRELPRKMHLAVLTANSFFKRLGVQFITPKAFRMGNVNGGELEEKYPSFSEAVSKCVLLDGMNAQMHLDG